jgi:hypothetical protein
MTRWVLILSLLGLGLWILDYLVYYAGAFFIPLGEEFATFDQIMANTVLIPAIASLGAWLLGIVDTLRRGLWGWFILTLLVPLLGSLIYSLVTLRTPEPQIT